MSSIEAHYFGEPTAGSTSGWLIGSTVYVLVCFSALAAHLRALLALLASFFLLLHFGEH